MQSSAAETCLRDPAALASSCVFIEVLRDLPHQPTSANFRQNRDGHIQAAHRQQACLWHIQSRRGSQIFFCFLIVNLQKLACGGRNDSIDVFEDSLMGDQRKERVSILTGYRQAFEKIMKDK